MTDRTLFLWDEPDRPSRSWAPDAQGRLEPHLGRPRESWTAEDLVRFARGRHLQLLALMHVGGDGWLKTLDFVPRGDAHLLDALRGGERADGSSLFSELGIPARASDIVLRPRPESAFLDPFAPVPALVVLCGHAGRDGRPLPESPDTIVRRAWQHVREETGLSLWALGEVEFFLGRPAAAADAYGADERGYHAASPFVFGEGLRRRAIACLADMGVPVKYAHSEVGYIEPTEAGGVVWEQHEIELGLLPLPLAADAIVLTQWVLRNLAHQAGWLCRTDPVMAEHHAGNGLHVHLSPVRQGAHVGGHDAAGNPTDATRWLLGGLVQMAPALMAFGNRAPGSFLRLRQAREAPREVRWGRYDRSALVRLPVIPTTEDGEAVAPATIEFRLPDGSAHPHLVMAGIAQALLKGRKTEDLDALLAKTAARDGTDGEPVPRDFAEVADALERDRASLEDGGVFAPHVIDRTLARLRTAPRPE